MPSKAVTVKWLTQFTSELRQMGFRKVAFEVRSPHASATRVFSDLQPSVTDKGHPSTRTILLREDGRKTAYDGKVEVIVVATLLDGRRVAPSGQ